MLINCQNPKGYKNEEEVKLAIARASSVIKLACGVCNNATYYIMTDAHDKIKKHPSYKHKVKQAYKRVIAAWGEYERRLIYPPGVRFFHMDDMTPEVRKKYGKISDRDYYDFWAGIGGAAYAKTRPFITSLWNKYRLSLANHNVPYPSELAWVLTTMAAFELCCDIYTTAVRECANQYGLRHDLLDYIFKPFNLRKVADLWKDAMMMTEPMKFSLTSLEDKNIELGLRQLNEVWANPDLMYDSTREVAEDYSEVFRTKGEQRKAIGEINKIKNATIL